MQYLIRNPVSALETGFLQWKSALVSNIACIFALLCGTANAADPPAVPTIAAIPATGAMHSRDLVRMNRCDLENLYRGAQIGCPPRGVTRGRAIINPGSKLTVPTSKVVRVLWQGKVITDDGMMVNRVFGMRAIHARVYIGESWLDGKPTVVMDYAGTSKLFPSIRDEVREISPGLYLGMAFKRTDAAPELKAFFTLESRKN
ncbi:MAG TPA: hypothetical protein VGL71_03820 [Urbifossiella sp.]